MTTESGQDDTGRDGARGARASAFWRFLPLFIFIGVGAVFAALLYDPPDDALRSVLIDQPAPDFSVPTLIVDDGSARAGEADPRDRLDLAALQSDRVSIVNFWASWCVPCRVEHPALMALADVPGVAVYGVAYHDAPEDSLAFLRELGNPFARVGVDRDGQTGLIWGLEGVPETFVVSSDGRVIYKHVGPIQNDDMDRLILPAIRAAQRAGG